jgi:uncharacterized protein YndB with AHSA1/START domain
VSDVQGSEAVLRLERLIPAPPELLFSLWVEPTQLVRWWAPDGYEALVHTLDARPGGCWRVVLRGAGGNLLPVSGVYRVVDPPRRLAFTWAWEDATGVRGHQTEVDVVFEATQGGTRLVLQHQTFESEQARNGHDAGWSSGLDRLSKIFAR